jgi:hypothetical protein
MTTQPYMWPFSLFAPGNLNQPILPGWFSNVSVNYAGNADIEKEVVEKVASYGKQLGIITDSLLVLAGDPKPDGEDPIGRLRKIAAEVRKLKEEHKRSLSEEARDAMAKLANSEPAEAARIARSYVSKKSDTGG